MNKVKLVFLSAPPNLVSSCMTVKTSNNQQEDNEYWLVDENSGSSEIQEASPSSGDGLYGAIRGSVFPGFHGKWVMFCHAETLG